MNRLTGSSQQQMAENRMAGHSLRALTSRQMQCLQFITRFYMDNGIYPTRKQIIEAMGLNSNNADSCIRPLVSKGYLFVDHSIGRKSGRNIRLTQSALWMMARLGVEAMGSLAVCENSDPANTVFAIANTPWFAALQTQEIR